MIATIIAINTATASAGPKPLTKPSTATSSAAEAAATVIPAVNTIGVISRTTLTAAARRSNPARSSARKRDRKNTE